MIILKARENWCVSQVTGKRSCQNRGGIPNFFHALFWPSSTLVTTPSPRSSEWMCVRLSVRLRKWHFAFPLYCMQMHGLLTLVWRAFNDN